MGRMWTQGDNFRVIAGRYCLEARLGRGGMGVVWRATDLLLGRRVAVKELSLDETLPEAEARWQRDRTLREGRAVAQLRHPHIIVVHDVVEDDERLYLVMELIDGGSLADRIAVHGPVVPAEAARIGIDLLGALRAAHEAGVLHRDIKPANVLLEGGTGRVVLTDFGVAQVAGATTVTEVGSFVGSPEYTAPERMSGARTGPESDLWSLGALLCTALSGQSPFRRDSLGGILHAVVVDEIRPPAQAAPLLPVVRGLLERDPDRRLDAAQAERMLRAFLATGRTPTLAPVYTSTQRDLPQQQPVPGRHSTRGVLMAGLLVAAMAGAGVSAAALLMNRDGNGGGTPPSSSPRPSVSTPIASSASRSSLAPSASGSSSAPTASPSSLVPSAHAPSGYRVADDPAGFSLAVPEGFTRKPQGERVFYELPGQTFRLGIKGSDPEQGGPLAVMRRAAAKGPSSNPGYHDGRVTSTTHHGQPGALWEFTWDGLETVPGCAGRCWPFRTGGRGDDLVGDHLLPFPRRGDQLFANRCHVLFGVWGRGLASACRDHHR